MKIDFSDKNQYGELIRRLRKSEKLTQIQCAEKAGISQAALAQYERGVRVPKPEKLNQILSALGYSLTLKIKRTEQK